MNNTVFVVSEFNPFHCGHEYLIKELKKSFERVVCIMSGNTVQRGELALCDKYIRARAAVRGGADLVLELPFPYSSLSARDFAYSAITVADRMCGKVIGFGCENDLKELQAAATMIDGKEVSAYIKANPNTSYPKAVQSVYKAITDNDGSFISYPNNILGIEYLRAIAETNSLISPYTVKRDKKYYSSKEIRNCLKEDRQYGLYILPKYTKEEIANDIRQTDFLDVALLASLRKGRKEGIYGVDESNYACIANAAESVLTVSELCRKACNVNLTNSRIRRTALLSFFGVQNNFAHRAPSYTTLLASNTKGREYLSENKKNISIPVITKPAYYHMFGDEVKRDFEFALNCEGVIMMADGRGKADLLRKTPAVFD